MLLFLVVFSMIGKLFDNNCLLCSSQVVLAITFWVMGKELAKLPLVAIQGDCQVQVAILSFYSFLHMEIFSFQVILFPKSQNFVSIQRNVTAGDMISVNNCLCRVTSMPCTQRLLCLLQVKSLVLLAIEKFESLWTNKFKFHKME